MKNKIILCLLLILIVIDLGLWVINFIYPGFNGLTLAIPVLIINFFIFIGIFNKTYRKLFLLGFIFVFITQFIIVMYEQKLQHQGNQFGSLQQDTQHLVELIYYQSNQAGDVFHIFIPDATFHMDKAVIILQAMR